MSTKASVQEQVAALKGVPALLWLVILLIAVVLFCFVGWKWETYEREKLERELNKLNAEMKLILSERQDIAAQERQKFERTLGELNVEMTRKQSELQNNAFQEKQKLECTLHRLNMELKLQQSGPQLTYSQVMLMILAAVASVVGIGYVIAKRVWEIELKVRQKNDKEMFQAQRTAAEKQAIKWQSREEKQTRAIEAKDREMLEREREHNRGGFFTRVWKLIV